jgi:hypothetical protein
MFVENLIVSIHYCSCCEDGTEHYKINAKTKDDFIKILSNFPRRKIGKHWISKDVMSNDIFNECLNLSAPFFEQRQAIIRNKDKIRSEITKLQREQKDVPYRCKHGYSLTLDQVMENDCYEKKFDLGIFSLKCLLTEQEELEKSLFELDSDKSNEERVSDRDLFPNED